MAEDFVQGLGLPFLAHRLRRLAELIVEGTRSTMPKFQLEAPARSASTLLLLREFGPMGITEIGFRLRLSHPMIIKLARALEAAGLVEDKRDPQDQRRRLVALTPAGREQADRAVNFNAVLAMAFEDIFAEAGADLLAAVEGFEAAAGRRSIAARIEAAAAHGLTRNRALADEGGIQ